MSDNFSDNLKTSHLSGGNAAFLEGIYEDYLKADTTIETQWRDYFRGLSDDAPGGGHEIPHGPIRDSFAQYARDKGTAGPQVMAPEGAEKQAQVLRLINAYRVRGHEVANLDPLDFRPLPTIADLDPGYHGLGQGDMDAVFNTGSLNAPESLSLREIMQILRQVYCGSIGAEYMHITDTAQKRWLQARLENPEWRAQFSPEHKRAILEHLTAAEGIEKYLHSKFVGQKRFSLEGGCALIPQLDQLIRHAAHNHADEVVIGMAHRGRLNVLVNILGKSPAELFQEFEGAYDIDELTGSGDVKYHMGFSTDINMDGNTVHLVLAFNPSHLEIVNPVVSGSVRARQQRRGDIGGNKILPIQIHGDSAFAGQGVVMETLQMSKVRSFDIGGTIHIVINNQVGFTTSDPRDTRSTRYSTDVAKFVEAPILHVNGDDPEAVVFATNLALDFRNEFHKDVVIDLVCYRRHGHNEADEPSATQPMMYKKVKARPTCRSLYGDQLVEEGSLPTDQPAAMASAYRDGLDEGRNIYRHTLGMVGNKFTADWSSYRGDWQETCDTSLTADEVKRLGERLTDVPEGIALHPRVARIIQDRVKMTAGGTRIDWGFAETLAYASLLNNGNEIRLIGQDAGRGTFFHRHAVLHNQQDGSNHVPLKHIAADQPDFHVADSFLSEEAVLAFEYGYSTTNPNSLVIWEAQFGDFANGAQVVIDQFIASGEAKWMRLCGLVMFLPHGYEGQGPEHSSARLERYLQLCAEQNIQVCVPSTPAQMFHMLRRQMLRKFRKPLVVMTPKSLLRHRLSTSTLEEITSGGFQALIGETEPLVDEEVTRIVFCSGKVYFDLFEKRQELELNNVALVRLEQIYPFPSEAYTATIARYPNATDLVWCQEEPENQGAWYSTKHRLQLAMKPQHTFYYATRPGAASTAAGMYKLHARQQEALVEAALRGGRPLAGY